MGHSANKVFTEMLGVNAFVELYVGVGVNNAFRLYIIYYFQCLAYLLNGLFLGTDDIIWALCGENLGKIPAKVAKSGEETDDRHTIAFKKEISIFNSLTFPPNFCYVIICPRKAAYLYHDLNLIPLIPFSRISYAEKKKKKPHSPIVI